MKITLRRHERCNFPDFPPTHHRRQGIYPTALQGITTVEYVRFDGYKWDFCPRVYLLLQPIWHMVCPRISSGLHKGPSPRLSPANPGRHPECSRVARCGAIYPYPTHGLGFLPKSSDCGAEVARTDSLNLRIFLLVN